MLNISFILIRQTPNCSLQCLQYSITDYLSGHFTQDILKVRY